MSLPAVVATQASSRNRNRKYITKKAPRNKDHAVPMMKGFLLRSYKSSYGYSYNVMLTGIENLDGLVPECAAIADPSGTKRRTPVYKLENGNVLGMNILTMCTGAGTDFQETPYVLKPKGRGFVENGTIIRFFGKDEVSFGAVDLRNVTLAYKVAKGNIEYRVDTLSNPIEQLPFDVVLRKMMKTQSMLQVERLQHAKKNCPPVPQQNFETVCKGIFPDENTTVPKTEPAAPGDQTNVNPVPVPTPTPMPSAPAPTATEENGNSALVPSDGEDVPLPVDSSEKRRLPANSQYELPTVILHFNQYEDRMGASSMEVNANGAEGEISDPFARRYIVLGPSRPDGGYMLSVFPEPPKELISKQNNKVVLDMNFGVPYVNMGRPNEPEPIEMRFPNFILSKYILHCPMADPANIDALFLNKNLPPMPFFVGYTPDLLKSYNATFMDQEETGEREIQWDGKSKFVVPDIRAFGERYFLPVSREFVQKRYPTPPVLGKEYAARVAAGTGEADLVSQIIAEYDETGANGVIFLDEYSKKLPQDIGNRIWDFYAMPVARTRENLPLDIEEDEVARLTNPKYTCMADLNKELEEMDAFINSHPTDDPETMAKIKNKEDLINIRDSTRKVCPRRLQIKSTVQGEKFILEELRKTFRSTESDEVLMEKLGAIRWVDPYGDLLFAFFAIRRLPEPPKEAPAPDVSAPKRAREEDVLLPEAPGTKEPRTGGAALSEEPADVNDPIEEVA